MDDEVDLEESSSCNMLCDSWESSTVDSEVIENSLAVAETYSDVLECNLNVVQNKRLELDDIQKDLDDLMQKLNTFIAETDASPLFDEVSVGDEDDCATENDCVLEKQDGPSEKELRLNLESITPRSEIYVTNGVNPPEVNWEAVGPILQKHVADLQKIHTLNQMTNAVVQRIRNVAKIEEDILSTTNTNEEKQ